MVIPRAGLPAGTELSDARAPLPPATHTTEVGVSTTPTQTGRLRLPILPCVPTHRGTLAAEASADLSPSEDPWGSQAHRALSTLLACGGSSHPESQKHLSQHQRLKTIPWVPASGAVSRPLSRLGQCRPRRAGPVAEASPHAGACGPARGRASPIPLSKGRGAIPVASPALHARCALTLNTQRGRHQPLLPGQGDVGGAKIPELNVDK